MAEKSRLDQAEIMTLATEASALKKDFLPVDERHVVTVPGTPISPERSLQLLSSAVSNSDAISVYTGINTCPYICDFCRYYNRISDTTRERNVNAVCKEMEMVTQALGLDLSKKVSVSSIYIGGGTPTLMSHEQWERIFKSLHMHFDVGSNTEITTETTPDTIDPDSLAFMRSCGLNRISMGVQRLDDEWYKQVKRKHSVADVMNALTTLEASGIRFNIDLMYGFEGQAIEQFYGDVEKIAAHRPSEITTYRYESAKRTDDRAILGPEKSALEKAYAMKIGSREILLNAGYQEGASGWFRLPGLASSQVYEDRWRHQRPMVSFGPEAYSFSAQQQHTNFPFDQYLKTVEAGGLPIDPARTFEYEPEQQTLRRIIFDLKSGYATTIKDLDSPTAQFFADAAERGLGEISSLDQDTSLFSLSDEGKVVIEEMLQSLRDKCEHLGLK